MGSLKQRSSFLCFEVSGKRCALPLAMVEGVASLPEIVAIPGLNSRVVAGLGYILGQIMTVVDIAPLCNLGRTEHARDVLVVQWQGEYYALKINAVGSVVSGPRLQKSKHPISEVAEFSFKDRDENVTVLDGAGLIQRYICS